MSLVKKNFNPNPSTYTLKYNIPDTPQSYILNYGDLDDPNIGAKKVPYKKPMKEPLYKKYMPKPEQKKSLKLRKTRHLKRSKSVGDSNKNSKLKMSKKILDSYEPMNPELNKMLNCV